MSSRRLATSSRLHSGHVKDCVRISFDTGKLGSDFFEVAVRLAPSFDKTGLSALEELAPIRDMPRPLGWRVRATIDRERHRPHLHVLETGTLKARRQLHADVRRATELCLVIAERLPPRNYRG